MSVRSKAERQRTRALAADALVKQHGRCCYCNEPITLQQATGDHRLARSRSGMNVAANIVAACEPCNKAKGSMLRGDFLRLVRGREAPVANISILMAWARRRIFVRTDQTCRRIVRFAC